MSKKIVTYLNYETAVKGTSRYETINPNSMTVPDQAISIEDLAHNYTRKALEALPHFEAIYYGDVEPPNIRAMDAVDRLQYANDLKSWISETESELKQAQAELTKEKDPLKKAKQDLQQIEDAEVVSPEGEK